MASPSAGPTSWSVPVLAGPSSADNLITTLVAWARHRGREPRSFHLSMMDEGRTLILRGFEVSDLRDFLRYAEYSSIPALECGTPRPLSIPAGPAPSTRTEVSGPGPDAVPLESPHLHPPTLSSQSIQMVMGTAQLLADRATNVRDAEHWVSGILAVPEVKPEHVGLLLRLLADPTLNTLRIALAGSPVLRQEGSHLLKVAPELIPDVLDVWLAPPAPGGAPPPQGIPPRPTDKETLLRTQVYAKGLISHAEHWKEVAARLRTSKAQGQPEIQSLVEGAVFINEEEGKVSWVVPSASSPVVRALVGYVQECHRLLLEELSRRETEGGSWVSPPRRQTFVALETARRATQIATRLGVEFRWVVLLSTSFAEGNEEGFGLPIGNTPPWDLAAAPPPPAPAAPPAAAPASPGGVIKRKPSPPMAPTVVGFARFSLSLEAPLDPWLQQQGIEAGMLRSSRKAAASAPKPAAPTAPAASEAAPAPVAGARPSVKPKAASPAPPAKA